MNWIECGWIHQPLLLSKANYSSERAIQIPMLMGLTKMILNKLSSLSLLKHKNRSKTITIVASNRP